MAINPLNGQKIPIIHDSILVNPEFGSGAVKITPSLSKADFECAKRNNLPIKTLNTSIFNLRGEKRSVAIQKLSSMGQLNAIEPYETSVPICSRSGDLVEEIVKPQWYFYSNQKVLKVTAAGCSSERKA